MKEQTYRDTPTSVSRLHPVPPGLKEILHLVNLVPPETDLPELDLEWYSERTTDAYFAAVGRLLDRCLEDKPENFREYVLQHDDSPRWKISRYNFIRESREMLREIARCAIEGRDLVFIPSYSEVRINEVGILQVIDDKFASAVDGVDARRIRECENCDRLFWAGRVDAPCCSTRCATNLRNQVARFLRNQGFPSGVTLTKEEQAKKQALIESWRKQRKERNPLIII